jgi:hypothetical protein
VALALLARCSQKTRSMKEGEKRMMAEGRRLRGGGVNRTFSGDDHYCHHVLRAARCKANQGPCASPNSIYMVRPVSANPTPIPTLTQCTKLILILLIYWILCRLRLVNIQMKYAPFGLRLLDVSIRQSFTKLLTSFGANFENPMGLWSKL